MVWNASINIDVTSNNGILQFIDETNLGYNGDGEDPA